MTIENVFGEAIPVIEDEQDLYWVPPDQRKDIDDDPDANALQSDPFDPDSTDDDMIHEEPD